MRIRLVVVVGSTPVPFAQGWDVDARTAGVGGIGGAQNIFAIIIQEQRGDRSIIVPLGLIQLLLDR